MNANIPPSSYHQAAATAASPQQIPISIPNSQSFDAATNEIHFCTKFWNKEFNRFKIIVVQTYCGLRSKIGPEIDEDRLKNDHGNDAEHYKFIGGYLVTNMVQCPMKHHVHHQVTLKFRYRSMILTLTFLKGLHWIEFSEQLIRFVPEILQSSN
ncbi:hypothetical protein HUG17_3532 [Dermatophagoides farinae]|uniref:Uncharacterized protein n=1 Tax=Dermatophagoides farinae TaxID=6954 RepID=A0A9D4NWA8_DERFA|nr:hypothetical protein HUG17_3532 [Dermatophagoides farinae]